MRGQFADLEVSVYYGPAWLGEERRGVQIDGRHGAEPVLIRLTRSDAQVLLDLLGQALKP
jgi:hypothetical protein